MKSLEEFIEQGEAAKVLHQTAKTVGNWARLKIIPSYKVGKKRLFRKSELIDWIEKQVSKTEVEMETWARKFVQNRNEERASRVTN